MSGRRERSNSNVIQAASNSETRSYLMVPGESHCEEEMTSPIVVSYAGHFSMKQCNVPKRSFI